MQKIIFQSLREPLDILKAKFIPSQADSCPSTKTERKVIPVPGGQFYATMQEYNIKRDMQCAMFMCPCCFEVFVVQMEYSININAVNLTRGLKLDFGHILKVFADEGCPECNEEVEFVKLDPNIASTISILNQKGYYTAFCCEHHFGEDCGSSSPYVAFKNTDIFDYLDYLPDSWYPDFESYKLYGTPVLRATTPRNPYELKETIFELLDFVRQLPISKTLSSKLQVQ